MVVMDNVKEMNKFLKGIHMGGSTFKDYLQKAKEPAIKNELIQIIESFKRHEEAITHRIEMLGGNAADTLGIMGTMADFFEKVKLIPVNTDFEVCERATAAIEMGMSQGERFIEQNKDLDPNLMKEVEAIVKDYEEHLTKMQDLMRRCI
jgi:hypothetical protein